MAAVFEWDREIDFTDMYATNFSFPKKLKRLVLEDMREIEDLTGERQYLNRHLIRLIMKGGNFDYKKDTGEYYRKRNGFNLNSALDILEAMIEKDS